MALLSLLLACSDRGQTVPADDSGGTYTTTFTQCGDTPTIGMVREYREDTLPDEVSHEKTLQGVALGDLDGDGWLDAIMAYGGGSAGFRNDGDGELILDPGIDTDGGPLPSAQAVALADIDGDGDLDAYLGRDRGELGVILTNDGTGHFVSTTLPDSAQAAMTGAFADYDADGDLDLYVAATISETDVTGILDGTITSGDGDKLFILGSDGRYSDETEARIPADSSWGWTFQGSPLDADGDGDLDIYLAHDMGPYILPNRLLLNDGTGHFTRAEDCLCELVMYAMGAAVGDADGDGLPDLYITDIGGPNLLLNLGDGRFVDATEASGASVPPDETTLTSWGVTFVDINQDTWLDLAMTFGQLGQADLVNELSGVSSEWTDGAVQDDVLLLGAPGGQFARAMDAWPDGKSERAIAVGDLDRDGVPDLVTVGKYFLRQWRTYDSCGPGVRVLVHGKGLNPQAIGAKVQVDVGGRTVTQWSLPSTTGSSSAPELYFGLGTLPATDGGRVVWPDGTELEFGPASAGETLDLEWL